MTEQIRVPQVNFEPIILGGGWDQTTPILNLKSGVVKYALNFECAPSGGYARVSGYERFDGQGSPTDSSTSSVYLSVTAFSSVPTVGQTLTASGGATGVIAYISGQVMVLCKVTGTFAVAETVSVGATLIGTVNNVNAGPSTPLQSALGKNAVADIYRAGITTVPGKGAIRGVFYYNDVAYAFRDNDATPSTSCDLYKSTTAGWAQVAYLKSVSFTSGGAVAPADGATLTQGAVTAVIKRVVRSSGSWAANTAAGQFIIATPAGGHFSAAGATIGAVNVTISGAESSVAMLPGGTFEIVETNFAGQDATRRIYGVDGKNKGFEFDGTTLVPIATGMASDIPSHIVAHKNYLIFTFGSSLMGSSPGLPFDWTSVGGAWEIAVGETITGAIVLPGGTTSGTLAVTSRGTIYILYGNSPTDFNLVTFNSGTGAAPYSLQNMAQTYLLDDRGVFSLQTVLQYGNFSSTSITAHLLPFINAHAGKLNCSVLNKVKNQYCLFFDNGDGLYVTAVDNNILGSMPVNFPDIMTCAYEAKNSLGQEIILTGATNGFVYQHNKGTSFDGGNIYYHIFLNYASAKGPRILKRYRKAALEIYSDGPCYAEFKFGYSLGYGSDEYAQPDNTDYFKYLQDVRWDTFYWDDFFWDSNGIGPVECEMAGTAENVSLAIIGMSDYVPPFTVNSAVIHYTPRRAMR